MSIIVKKIIFSVTMGALFIFAPSCGNSSASMKFKTIEVKEFVKHPKATKDDQGLTYDIRFTCPAAYGDKVVLKALQQKFIRYTLQFQHAIVNLGAENEESDYTSLTPEKAVGACIEDLKKRYFNEVDEPGEFNNYTFILHNSILFVNDVLLQLKTENYVKTDGSGFSASSSPLFNLKTGEEYGRDDIFKPETAQKMRQLIIAELFNYWKAENNPHTDSFAEEGVWTEHTGFAVTDAGILFSYSDYELGARALGTPQITIPYAKMRPFLREGTPVWDMAAQSGQEPQQEADTPQPETPREQTIINVFGRLNMTEEEYYEYVNYWTDGWTFYRPFFYDPRELSSTYRSDGNTIYFYGGDLHEGGIGFNMNLAADGILTIINDDYPDNQGDRVEYRTVDGEPLLIISDVRTKAVKKVWKKLEGGKLRELYLNDYLRYALAGTYRSVDGKTITFPANRFCVSGLWVTSDCTTYTFGEEYESPVLTIVHPNKDRAFVVRKTLTGLELVPVKFSEEDDWWVKDESKPRTALVKTAEAWSNLPLEERQGIRGRFTLASEQVMTTVELRCYAGHPVLQNLKIMRNEIFARHGYKFTSKDMADYFGAKAWYVPQYDDVTSRLTEIERINIALIYELEKKYEDWWDK